MKKIIHILQYLKYYFNSSEIDYEYIEAQDFIRKQIDIKSNMMHDGAYYHYIDVCKLINRYKKELEEKS